jgi:Flp pilus assembly pilin Flp
MIKQKLDKSENGNVLTEYLLALGALAIGLLTMMPSLQTGLDQLYTSQVSSHSNHTDYPQPIYDTSYDVTSVVTQTNGNENEDTYQSK